MSILIDKTNALKAFYYIITIDGVIDDNELEQFNQIGREILQEHFDEVKDTVISECNAVLSSISKDENRYDIIIENLDKALSEKADSDENGIWPRYLLWNMLAIAYSDNDFSEDEKRFTDHTARMLNIDKSVYTEMIQYISTAIAVQKELEELETSDRPYSEIRPLVEENEKRKASIIRAATELIEDEVIMLPVEHVEHKKKENKLGMAVAAQGKKIGDALSPAAQNVGKAAANGAKNLKDGAGKLFSKVKGAIQNNSVSLPEKYVKIKKKPDDMELPKDAVIYGMDNGSTKASVICFSVTENESMDFDNREGIIDALHQDINEHTGIIEVKSGVAKNGGKYIYHILKSHTYPESEIPMGNSYSMNLNIQIGNTIQFVNCDFQEIGMTGLRESIVFPILMKAGKVGEDFSGWSEDPYDKEYTKGFLMNQSEKEEFDKVAPEHPLSELRRLANFIIGTN